MDNNVWANDALALTQDQAEHNRYRVGVWTQEQYEAYMHVWAVGKHESVAREWHMEPHPDTVPLIELLLDRVPGIRYMNGRVIVWDGSSLIH